jgi:TolB-like protein
MTSITFPSYRGNEPYVFVSYAHLDGSLVQQEINFLNEAGHKVWYDEGITAGSEWREEIARAIQQSACVIYFVSPNSVKSAVCVKEVSYALSERIPTLPVLLEQATLPAGIEAILNAASLIQYDAGSAHFHEQLNSRLMPLLVAADQTLNADAKLLLGVAPFSATTAQAADVAGFVAGLGTALAQSFAVTTLTEDASLAGLGVTHLVEGSIRTSGPRMRVTVRLTDAASSTLIWSESFDRQVAELDLVCGKVAAGISRTLAGG